MEASVATVGRQLLVGREVEAVAADRQTFELLIRDVLDRVLLGYSVREVSLRPGPVTEIRVAVDPWGERVGEVVQEIEVTGVPQEAVPLIRQDAGNLTDAARLTLVGLPVDAVEWAGGVARGLVRETLSDRLPEFRASIEIVPGPKTVIKILLAPAGALVQEVNLDVRSRTIPSFFVGAAKPRLEAAGRGIIGLPVAFVARHLDYYSAKFQAVAAAHPVTRTYGLKWTADIRPGRQTDVSLKGDTDKYQVYLEGYLDMGRGSVDTTSFKMHAGVFTSPGQRTELFTEVTFIPSTVKWDFWPGIGQKVGEASVVGVKYSLDAHKDTLLLYQRLGPRYTLRCEYTPADQRPEIGFRYKVHEFFSVEYVFTDRESWLRLVGNL